MWSSQVWEGIEPAQVAGHNHRCHGCGVLIDKGAGALFVRLARHIRYAAHLACADVPDSSGVTMRQKFEAWARNA